MTNLMILLIASISLTAVALLFVFLLWRRNPLGSLASLEHQYINLERVLDKSERGLRDEFARAREESSTLAKQGRDDQSGGLKLLADRLSTHLGDIATQQTQQLELFAKQLATLTQSNETRIDKMRETLESRLRLLQDDNNKKLDQMRATVDEKLHATLEKRLGESFKLVSERLELVHKGLGEMQSLANGVGDLRKVLTNVKTRGIWGEMQLGNLLEQILTPDQYACNVAVKPGTQERVEFAIKLPGHDVGNTCVWLPIDAKFPQEDYHRLLEAVELVNPVLAEEAGRQLEIRIKGQAKDIRDKYIEPPHTTDFAILFLPVEGLYAEVLRRPGLSETLQKEFRIVVAGPTTLAALLNSLQMGFRTLTIEKRSSEVWNILAGVKTEFVKFGDILDKTQKKLLEASNNIDLATQKSRTIERKLRKIEELPVGGDAKLEFVPPLDELVDEILSP